MVVELWKQRLIEGKKLEENCGSCNWQSLDVVPASLCRGPLLSPTALMMCTESNWCALNQTVTLLPSASAFQSPAVIGAHLWSTSTGINLLECAPVINTCGMGKTEQQANREIGKDHNAVAWLYLGRHEQISIHSRMNSWWNKQFFPSLVS